MFGTGNSAFYGSGAAAIFLKDIIILPLTCCSPMPTINKYSYVRIRETGDLMSGLRDRLNIMRQQAQGSARSAVPIKRGLEKKILRIPADPGLFSINPSAMRRMGLPKELDVRECLFIDAETTGLSGGAGTVPFLVCAGYVDGTDFVTVQLFMPDYSAEPEMLFELSELMNKFKYAVTFNGRLFDMPLIETRFTINRMRDRYKTLENADLLYPSRRLWKRRLKSCCLANIEKRVLGIERTGDVSGAEVPERYFRYMRTGDESLMEAVIYHNRQDVISLGLLLARLNRDFLRPEEIEEQLDMFSAGLAIERSGEPACAREVYRLASIPGRSGTLRISDVRAQGAANWRLAAMMKRNGEYDSAAAVYEKMIKRRQMAENPYVELAKLLEHKLKNLDRALKITEQALEMFPDSGGELSHRAERLRRKLSGK